MPVTGGHGVLRGQQALEPGVCGGVLALLEIGLDVFGVQVRVEFGAAGAGNAVRRPAVLEIGCLGEVRAGIDMPVLGGHDVVELAVVGAPTYSLMAPATAAPPATARAPPSQKSFWTSTMISARDISSPQFSS